MSSVLPELVSVMKSYSPLTSVVGSRVYADVMPEDVEKPAILLYVTSENAEDCLGGFVGYEVARVRVEAYGNSRSMADGALEQARQSLNGYTGVAVTLPIKGVSQATGKIDLVDKPNDGTDRWLFRTVQNFLVTYNSF